MVRFDVFPSSIGMQDRLISHRFRISTDATQPSVYPTWKLKTPAPVVLNGFFDAVRFCGSKPKDPVLVFASYICLKKGFLKPYFGDKRSLGKREFRQRLLGFVPQCPRRNPKFSGNRLGEFLGIAMHRQDLFGV